LNDQEIGKGISDNHHLYDPMGLLHSVIYPPPLSLIDQVYQRILSLLHLLDRDDLPIPSLIQRPTGTVMVTEMVIMTDLGMVMGEKKVDRQVGEVVF
jgi:hypothetical protein